MAPRCTGRQHACVKCFSGQLGCQHEFSMFWRPRGLPQVSLPNVDHRRGSHSQVCLSWFHVFRVFLTTSFMRHHFLLTGFCSAHVDLSHANGCSRLRGPCRCGAPCGADVLGNASLPGHPIVLPGQPSTGCARQRLKLLPCITSETHFRLRTPLTTTTTGTQTT